MKDRIIEIALRQMREGGYDHLNFANIASELGTTRANLHHHFKNKDGLAEAALNQYVAEEKRKVDQILQKHGDDLPGFLEAMEDHLIGVVAAGGQLTACVGSQIVRDSVAPQSLRAIALHRFREEARDIENLVERYSQNVAVEASANLAFRIVSAMHGIDMMMQISDDREDLIRKIKGALTPLLH